MCLEDKALLANIYCLFLKNHQILVWKILHQSGSTTIMPSPWHKIAILCGNAVQLSAAILCPDKHPQLETEHISSPRQETCWLVVSRHFLKGQRNWVLECVTGPVKPASQPALWILLSNPNCPNRLRCDHSSHWADSSLIHLVKVHRVKQWMEISVNGWCQTECYNPRHQKCFCGGVPIRLW